MARRGDRLRQLLRSPRESDRVEAAERIRAVLAAEGSVARAARRLGLSESTIRRRARGPTRPRVTAPAIAGPAARRRAAATSRPEGAAARTASVALSPPPPPQYYGYPCPPPPQYYGYPCPPPGFCGYAPRPQQFQGCRPHRRF